MHSFLRRLRYLVRRTLLLVRLFSTRKNGLSDFRSVLVIAPHPDDEVIGLGGYLARQSEAACSVAIVYLSDGEKSLEDIEPQRVAEERRRLSLDVHERLGIVPGKAWWLGLPDGAIPRKGQAGFDGAVEKVAEIIRRMGPDAVFVTHPLDTGPSDHIAAYEITDGALNNTSCHGAFFGYWVWLWYSMPAQATFRMHWRNISRIPLDGLMQAKKKILMNAYMQPLSPNGKSWSGVLPKALLKAFDYPFEVVERFR